MQKKNILIFPCGSEIGLEIYNGLKWSRYFRLFGVSSDNNNHGQFVYKNYINKNLPLITDKNFLPELNKLLIKYNIDFIFPANDDVGLYLSEKRDILFSKLIYSSYQTAKICRSKSATYRLFKNIISVPKIFSKLEKNLNFPLFLKPDAREGSQGVFKVNTKKELYFYLNQDPTLLILEYLPGREYTIDCFTDRNRKLRFVGARVRSRISRGISVRTFPVDDYRFEEIADKINKKLKLRGAWFFQVKERNNGDLVLMEVAPRIAGTMALYRVLGINFPLLTLFDFMNFPINVIKNHYFLKMDRALINRYEIDFNYKHVYIDLDDVIISNRKINTTIIMFLYQCINKKIKIHLISKHKKNINLTLKKYRLQGIFDSIIIVKKNQEKAEFIKEKKAIFIDDSFIERKKIYDTKNIPVFDTNAVESLLNWKN